MGATMGREAYANTMLGIWVSREDLAPLTKSSPEKSHHEDRYDPKTGVMLIMKEKIVDQEAFTGLEIDGVIYPMDDHEAYEVCDVIKEVVGAESVAPVIDCNNGNLLGFVAGRSLGSVGPFNYGSGTCEMCPLGELGGVHREVDKWRAELVKLGITVTDEACGISTYLSVSD